MKRTVHHSEAESGIKLRKMNDNGGALETHCFTMDNGPKVASNHTLPGPPLPCATLDKTARKLVLKNFVKPIVSRDHVTKAWAKLEEAVICIQNSTPVNTSLEMLYKQVGILCDSSQTSELFTKLCHLIETNLKSIVKQLIRADNDPVAFLRLIDKCWADFCRQMNMIQCIFMILDRTYILKAPQARSIWDTGLEMFRQHVVHHHAVQSKLVESLLQLISKERSGQYIDRQLMRNILRMLIDLSVYCDLFEVPFLSESKRLYRMEAAENIRTMPITEYLAYVERRLAEERDRLVSYLDHATSDQLIKIVNTELLRKHLDSLFKSEFDQLFNEYNSTRLKLAFNLLKPIEDGHKRLCDQFRNYVKEKGKSIVSMSTPLGKNQLMVSELLAFKDQMNYIVANCFNQEDKFIYSLKDAFEYFINQGSNKPAELIAKFLDAKLRSGNKEASEEEFETMLEKILVLFRFIHGKDIFEAFYKQDLAKRLLCGKSASVDAEKSMIYKLKVECGSGFTSKLEGMFKDIELSADLMPHFKQFLRNEKPEISIDMSVSILTLGYWPDFKPLEITMPSELYEYEQIFTKFYTNRHSGRKLQWQREWGQLILKSYSPCGHKELQVSLFQGVILLMFDQRDSYTLDEIRGNIFKSGHCDDYQEEYLRRTLQSLACGKARVLIKVPKGRDVLDGDTFYYNAEFRNKHFRIRINQIQLKETHEENERTQERVFQDRQHQIDAAVVRIMKTRKMLQQNQLISELFNCIKFPVTSGDVKKRIDSLVERDYLRQDPEDSNVYHYVS